MDDRKAFKFYKSYYDVALELPEQDRNEFLWAIVSAEFTGELIEPKSKLARLMFIGQKHSVIKQLDGFKAATKEPHEGGYEAPYEAPSQQVQVQVQVQAQVEDKSNSRPILTIGEYNEDKYILVVPPDTSSTAYRINGEDGFKQYFEMNRSIVKNKNKISTFFLSNNGAHFNEFMHVYRSFDKHIENNTQAYGR